MSQPPEYPGPADPRAAILPATRPRVAAARPAAPSYGPPPAAQLRRASLRPPATAHRPTRASRRANRRASRQGQPRAARASRLRPAQASPTTANRRVSPVATRLPATARRLPRPATVRRAHRPRVTRPRATEVDRARRGSASARPSAGRGSKFTSNMRGRWPFPTLVYFLALGAVIGIAFGIAIATSETTTTSYDYGNGYAYEASTSSYSLISYIVLTIGYMLVFFVAIYMQAGLISGALDIADGKPVTIGTFFKPRNVGGVLLTALLLGIAAVGRCLHLRRPADPRPSSLDVRLRVRHRRIDCRRSTPSRPVSRRSGAEIGNSAVVLAGAVRGGTGR